MELFTLPFEKVLNLPFTTSSILDKILIVVKRHLFILSIGMTFRAWTGPGPGIPTPSKPGHASLQAGVRDFRNHPGLDILNPDRHIGTRISTSLSPVRF